MVNYILIFDLIKKIKLSLHNELKIMRRLKNHPNVIKLFEVFEGESTFYFVMEIVEGISLYEKIKRQQSEAFLEEEIKEIIKMLLEGILYCG